ncbi:MAG: hypothetical protein WCC04_10015 [Terriglobales bacterium]
MVPPDALRSLLDRQPKKFAAYEKRFGSVPDRDRANLIGSFQLMERVRTGQELYEKNYLGFMRAVRKIDLQAASVRKPELYSKAQGFIQQDEIKLKNAGPVKTLSVALNLVNTVTHLMVWWNETTETLEPCLLALDFVYALYALQFMGLQSPESSAICARCKKGYTRTKTTQIFCSAKCSANERKARQRSREKESLSHGTRKAR